MKIRSRLAIALLLISLIPIAVVSGISYATVSKDLTAKTVDNLKVGLLRQKQRINAILDGEREQALQLSIKFDFKRAAQQYAANKDPSATVTMHTLLIAAQTSGTRVAVASLADLNGHVISSTDQRLIGKNISKEPYFKGDSNQENIQLIEATDLSPEGLYLTAPVTVENKPVAVVVMAFADDDIISVVQDYTGLGHTGETLLATQQGGKQVAVTPLRFKNDAAFRTDLSSLRLASTSDQIYMNVADYRGQRVMAATTYLDLVHWGIAAKIDRDEALRPISQLRTILILIAIVVAVIVVLVAVYFAGRLTAPIASLTEKARRISQGDFKQRVEVQSKDEVGLLAQTFNQMTAQLADLYSSLEQKVVEKTAQLSEKVQALQLAEAAMRAAKEKAEQAQAKDEAMLDGIGDGVVVTDDKGKIMLINGIAASLLNVQVEQVTGQQMADCKLYDEGGAPLLPEATPLQIALQTNQKTIKDVQSVFTDGSKLTLSVNATPVIQQGRVIGVIQIIRDVTKEKEVDRMKTEFISLASHQLRTPLSAIKWFSEMLLGGDAGPLNEEQHSFTQNVADSTERMIELVNSLLNISRIESGRIMIDPKPTDLKKLVEGIAVELEVKFREKKHRFALSVHGDLPLINVDPQLTRQVYLNLLTNAIKYTPEGGEIVVMISRKGEEMISQVADNGYGIPKAQQGKVFQKFFRAENITKIIADGTGLGLYLIKAIVDSQQGKIWFESEEGKGTTFWFSLPLAGVRAKKGEVTIDT